MDDREAIIDQLVEQWQNLESEGRAVSLADLCKDHPELLGEVSARIDALRSLAPLLDLDHDAVIAQQSLPSHVGTCEVIEEIDSSSSSVVYLALQRPTNRKVAVKVIHAARLNDESLARFRVEAKALGLLSHDGIAAVFDAGVEVASEQRLPYLTMEFIDGQTLDKYLGDENPDLTSRVQLLQQIADALSHAHQHGVIHRDLKPANIMVTKTGKPKLIDFGIARLDHPDFETITQTGDGHRVLGTIPYMSPEQLAGNSSALDVRTDIFSLGVIAYQAFGGELPFPTSRSTVPEAIRIVESIKPARLGLLNPACSPDLENVIEKTLHVDRRDRYQTAAGLADDLQNYLDGRPVSARPIGGLTKACKWINRNRLVATLVFLFASALLLGTAIASYLAVVARDAKERAQFEKSVATKQLHLMERNAYALQLRTAFEASFDKPQQTRDMLNDAAICPPRLRDFTWGLINRHAVLQSQFIRSETPIALIAASAFANHLAIVDEQGSVKIWDTGNDYGDGSYLRSRYDIPTDGRQVTAFAFSTFDAFFAAGLSDGTVVIQHGKTGEVAAIIDRDGTKPVSLAFQDDNDIVVVDDTGRVEIWGLHEEHWTLAEWFSPEAESKFCAAVATPRGTEVATAFSSGIVVRDFDSGKTTKLELSGDPTAIVFRSRYELLTVSGERIFRVNVPTKHMGPFHTELAPLTNASPLGRIRFAAATDDNIIVFGDTTRRLEGFADTRAVAFSSDKRCLYVQTGRSGVVLRRLPESCGPIYSNSKTLSFSIADAPLNEQLLLGGGSGEIFVIDRKTGKLEQRKKFFDCPTYRLAVSRTGKVAAFGGKVKVFSSDLSKRLARRDLGGEFITSLTFDAEESSLLFVTESGKAGSWNFEDKQPIEWLDRGNYRAIQVSAGGELLATSSDTGIEIRQVQHPENVIAAFASLTSVGPVAFSPDNGSLAICTEEKRIRILSIGDQTDVTCDGHERKVQALSFSPDGRTLASAGFDGSIRFWDTKSGLQRLSIRNKLDPYVSIQFSNDGKSLFAISTDGTWTIWDADIGNSATIGQ